MPLDIKVKRFSRSNTNYNSNETETEQQSETISKPKRSRKKEIIRQPEIIVEQESEEFNIIEAIEEPELIDNIVVEDDFLNDLNSANYIEPPSQSELKGQEREQKEMKRNQTKQQQEYLKQMKQTMKKETKYQNIIENGSDLFSDIPTEILGREKLETINKLNQYKNLFPKELSKFKVKKNATVEELKLYLKEAETLVETSSVDGFITDSILQSIKLTESISKRTKYDISGCAELLKANPKFHSLLKQLYCKYNCFAKIPLEFQLLIMVSTTSYMCVNKNKNKAHFEQYLNEPMKQEK